MSPRNGPEQLSPGMEDDQRNRRGSCREQLSPGMEDDQRNRPRRGLGRDDARSGRRPRGVRGMESVVERIKKDRVIRGRIGCAWLARGPANDLRVVCRITPIPEIPTIVPGRVSGRYRPRSIWFGWVLIDVRKWRGARDTGPATGKAGPGLAAPDSTRGDGSMVTASSMDVCPEKGRGFSMRVS